MAADASLRELSNGEGHSDGRSKDRASETYGVIAIVRERERINFLDRLGYNAGYEMILQHFKPS